MTEERNDCPNCKYDYHNRDVKIEGVLICYHPDHNEVNFWKRPIKDCWEASMDIYQRLADAGFEEQSQEHVAGKSGKCIDCGRLNKCDLIIPAVEEYGHPSLVWRGGCKAWRPK